MEEMRKRRTEILRQIDKLNSQRCAKCDDNAQAGTNKDKSFYECDCDAAVEVRKLGEQLLKLTTPRTWEVLLNKVSRTRRLSVSQYIELKRYGVYDEIIFEAAVINKDTFRLWKIENEVDRFNRRSDKEIKRIEKERGNITIKGQPPRRRGAHYSKEVILETLKLKEKHSYRVVNEMTKIPISTIRKWVAREKAGAL